MPLFEVAVIQLRTKKETEEGYDEDLILGPTAVVAKDRESAILKVTIDKAEVFKSVSVNESNVKVLVRPFV